MERFDGVFQIVGAILVFIITFTEVSGIICPNTGERCGSCCEGHCCVEDQESVSYTYRISFWNLWYFWFVILFILMSCFGGCGYYKHKQRLLLMPRDTYVNRGRTSARTTPGLGLIPSHTAAASPQTEPITLQPSISILPPPYSEVANLPKNQFEAKPPPYPGDKHGDISPPEYTETSSGQNQNKS
uniref:WW domain binding protein VOPP1 n=1 Tax=Magallana gigas TaxID=29159 RepID=A0A8W8MBK6_MAGGI|nr:WW domain binding protein 1-like [Crassostrea gigas]